MTKQLQYLRCQSDMEIEYIPDKGASHANHLQTWVEGLPEQAAFFKWKLPSIDVPTGSRKYYIIT